MASRSDARVLEFWPLADIEATLEHDLIPAAVLPVATLPADSPDLAALVWAVRLRSPASPHELADIAWFGWQRAEWPRPVALVVVIDAAPAPCAGQPGPITEVRLWHAEDAVDLAARLGGEALDVRPEDPRQGQLFAA